MALTAGTRLGFYEISSLLGAGGMGEVYRAKDTKLGREVAIKVLPEAFATDPERVARFKREAQVLASLNHPNIAALYGMEESHGQHFLIMELVEGETLAERLKTQGSGLKLEETLAIAHQMADALEPAHEKGVVHRDLKPANVKITPNERVKVLDFGLAKALEPQTANAQLTNSPTLSLMATQAGMILGTAAYMSPEQAEGKQTDHRSDVFSFGSVLYELLTGRPAFQGESAAGILASVLVREPELAALPPNLNPRLRELLKRCLEKSPKRRWQAVGDLRAEIEAIAATPRVVQVAATAPPRTLWKRAVPIAAAAVLAGALGILVDRYIQPSAPPLPVTRFTFTLGEGQAFGAPTRQLIAISPDGGQMIYAANNQLYLRPMTEFEARPIPGTEVPQGINSPVFSPDGRSIAFWSGADQTLKRIAVSGGAPVTICPADIPFGVSWSSSGILFGQGAKGAMRVAPSGGKPETLVAVKDGEQVQGPRMLPGDQAVLFTLAAGNGVDRWDKARVIVQFLKSGERKTLIEGGSDARYVPTGHLVYALGGVVFGVPFDLQRLEVVGGPVPVVEGIRRPLNPLTGSAHFSFSSTGSLVYIPGPASTAAPQSDLALIDRNGSVEPLKLPPGPYDHPRVSPNGKRIVFDTDDGKEAAVWIYDLDGASAARRLTFGGRNRLPIWSANGQRVAFQSDREGGDPSIWCQPADGNGVAERLTTPERGTSHAPESWSPKGDRFSFSVSKGSITALWTFSLADKKAESFGAVQSSILSDSVFSPDGRWLAYGSNEGGTTTIYVQPVPATGAKYQITKNTVFQSAWSPDGKELFSVPPGAFAVQSITTQPSFTISNPVQLPRGFQVLGSASPRNYDITPSGKILGVITAGQTQSSTPALSQVQVVLNWFEELKARVPAR